MCGLRRKDRNCDLAGAVRNNAVEGASVQDSRDVGKLIVEYLQTRKLLQQICGRRALFLLEVRKYLMGASGVGNTTLLHILAPHKSNGECHPRIFYGRCPRASNLFAALHRLLRAALCSLATSNSRNPSIPSPSYTSLATFLRTKCSLTTIQSSIFPSSTTLRNISRSCRRGCHYQAAQSSHHWC